MQSGSFGISVPHIADSCIFPSAAEMCVPGKNRHQKCFFTGLRAAVLGSHDTVPPLSGQGFLRHYGIVDLCYFVPGRKRFAAEKGFGMASVGGSASCMAPGHVFLR